MGKDYLSKDTPNRDRTFADRRAFVLAENASAMAAEITGRSDSQAGGLAAPPISGQIASARQRTLMREAAAAARRGAFSRALGELTFRAIPLDEMDKAPFHDTVVLQSMQLVEALGDDWDLSDAGRGLAEEVAAVCADQEPEVMAAAVTESCESGALSSIVTNMAGEIEQRVVAAAAATKERAADVERRLAEAAEGASDELAAARSRRLERRVVPTLMETLFLANRRALGESTAPEDALMAEAVCQYTLLETLNAVGVLRVGDTERFIKALDAIRFKH